MKSTPIRRGISSNYTLDPDSKTMLDALVGAPRGHGKLLSELVRREFALRCRLLDALPPRKERRDD